ncbi:response regulator transcription factor [Hazenella sp. IB182357]|uniref:Response regulator transcription factor n=1 Tax=Polycladospora coralii TaxID=2771432 RepID=A0A926RSX7_9BACL|nr:response regulator transcription factor [Polycladospora coralii]MBD1370918.1 response regulator transcription factor [Polycladospora coralii]MBS7529857.1 response regulator transcription factor [Polycladospora coralii]
MRLLIAEDDTSVCEMLDLFMRKEGYQVSFVHDGQAALDHWNNQDFDLIILDWMLPKMDGVRVCQIIRQSSDVPIILLTARTGESDQVLGLELGADDYVTKPFSPLALIARIKAILRRSQREQTSLTEHKLKSKYFLVNEEMREILYDGEVIEDLTPKEFELLKLFIQHPKRVFSREELLSRVWNYDFYGDERTVDAHIKRLRKKIIRDHHQWIQTVWGVGYKFVEDED